MKTDIISLGNDKTGSIDLDESVFGVALRPDLLHRTVRWQLAKRRAGTHKVKERGEVRGTTAKMYRQKGTGRARHGSRRVSQFVGGGVTFGPRVRSHAHKLPKKVRRLALKCALSAKQAEGKLVVIDSLAAATAKTSALAKQLAALGWTSVLLVDRGDVDENFRRAAGNLVGVNVLPTEGINVYDILRSDTLALTKTAVEALEARLK